MFIKQVLLLIVFSVAAILLQIPLLHGMKFLIYLHTELAHGLSLVFSSNKMGEVFQSTLALMFIPVAFGTAFAFAHFFIRQHQFSHTMTVIWFAWVILLVSVLTKTGHVLIEVAPPSQPIAVATAPANTAANPVKNIALTTAPQAEIDNATLPSSEKA